MHTSVTVHKPPPGPVHEYQACRTRKPQYRSGTLLVHSHCAETTYIQPFYSIFN